MSPDPHAHEDRPAHDEVHDPQQQRSREQSDAAPARWAVLGPGSIARRFATQLTGSPRHELVAVGSSDPSRAEDFAREFPLAGPRITGGYAEVLACPEVDAVYVATVHTGHAALVAAALQAGKDVLCEKPLAPTAGTVMALADLSRTTGRVLLEGFMYRFHPQTIRVLELIAQGAIGEIQHVDASFSFAAGGRSGRLFDPDLAGGGILDVGCYPMSLARFVAGAALGRPCAEPLELRARGTVADGVDEWAVADLVLPASITASIRAGIRVQEDPSATITGSRGLIRLADPWALGEEQVIRLDAVGEEPRLIPVPAAPAYAREADALIDARGKGEVAELTPENSLGQARALDAWREAIGLRYPFESDEAEVPPITGRPLRAPAGGTSGIRGTAGPVMEHGRIPGVDLPLSRLVMGCDNQGDLSHASALFDAFFEVGGNTFDTAYIYGGGRTEKLFGRWVRNRGIRDQVVVIVKGAHTPHCDPESLSRQLIESLERQGTDHADLYMMHRDDPAVPVGEFVDVLDAHADAGRIRAFGGSNWTPARIDEANAYAARTGRRGFSILSNHFGLARALDVPWEGCVQATDDASRTWLEERGMPLLPWSSQARGFFTGRADPADRSDAELVRCYYSEGNFERLRRARTLARDRGVPPTAIALAYVLRQPFPTFPLFGPRSIAEMRSSLQGLSVQLSPQELAWLDLREAHREE